MSSHETNWAPVKMWERIARQRQEYLSLQEAAIIVHVSVDTLRRRIRSGQLPAVRHGKLIRVHVEDLHALFRPIPVDDPTSMRTPRKQLGQRAGDARSRNAPRPLITRRA